MNSFTVFLAFALTTIAVAEPPSGYSYNHGGGGGGNFGGGFSSGIGGGGGGGYQAVSGGFQTSEGQNVDPQLLEQVRQILLNEESKSSSIGGGISAPSSSYGVPSSSYGAPGYSGGGGRVVGIDLDGIRQAIQVAQFNQITGGIGSSGGGIGISSSYGAPSRPSGSYGAPY